MGEYDGVWLGTAVGLSLGATDGCSVTVMEDGLELGRSEGDSLGNVDGCLLGLPVVAALGECDGY
jgi:hypothetical protein